MKRVTGTEYKFIRLIMTIHVWLIGTKAYHSPFKSFKAAVKLYRHFKKMFHGKTFVRAFKINTKYVWDLYTPAWPSKAFNSFFISRLHEVEPISDHHSALRRLLVAITKKCPLQCEHCCEADTLYQHDSLTLQELINRIEEFVIKGVSQLVYSGGEPLSRFNDLEKLITYFNTDCDQWIYTSGYGLTSNKVRILKSAGLNGAAISLDHHLEACHNKFRGNDKSYFWALEAVKNCNAAGIMTALNVCPTQEYLEIFDFEEYIHLARKIKVPVINIIEPRAVGNYKGKDVDLTDTQKEMLFRLSQKFNYTKSLVDFPTINFPASFRKTLPCGGGKIYQYMDFDGKLYPCPFCKVEITEPENINDVCLVS